MRFSLLLLLWACALGVGTSASAELFRCTGPDGKVVFTDDASACPGADPYEPDGRVSGARQSPESSDAGHPSSQAPRVRVHAGPDPEEAEAARWMAKRREKEAELQRIADERKQLQRFVNHCNRRGRVMTYDAAGIEQEVKCADLRQLLAALDTRESEVRTYLDSELAEECRRAGCLPGWIR